MELQSHDQQAEGRIEGLEKEEGKEDRRKMVGILDRVSKEIFLISKFLSSDTIDRSLEPLRAAHGLDLDLGGTLFSFHVGSSWFHGLEDCWAEVIIAQESPKSANRLSTPLKEADLELSPRSDTDLFNEGDVEGVDCAGFLPGGIEQMTSRRANSPEMTYSQSNRIGSTTIGAREVEEDTGQRRKGDWSLERIEGSPRFRS